MSSVRTLIILSEVLEGPELGKTIFTLNMLPSDCKCVFIRVWNFGSHSFPDTTFASCFKLLLKLITSGHSILGYLKTFTKLGLDKNLCHVLILCFSLYKVFDITSCCLLFNNIIVCLLG